MKLWKLKSEFFKWHRLFEKVWRPMLGLKPRPLMERINEAMVYSVIPACVENHWRSNPLMKHLREKEGA